MSHQLRFSNKENINDAENVHVSKKQTTTRNFQHRRRPLQGKDLNQLVPKLQKAQSSLFEVKPQGTRLQASRKPLLQKANSTLGFLEQKTTQTTPSEPKSSHKTPIKPLLTHNTLSNIPRVSPTSSTDVNSDSLIKKTTTLPPLHQTLNSTLSNNTQKLHSSNVPRQRISRDPIKTGYIVSREQLIEELADDPESVETIPTKKQIIEVPEEATTLTQDDLDFFSKPARALVVDDEADEYEKLYLKNEEQLAMNELDLDDPEVFGFPGMSTSDLQDLVDDI